MVKSCLFLLILLACALSATAQEPCATMDVLQDQLRQDPGLAGRMEVARGKGSGTRQTRLSPTEVITIPVVVHVVYDDSVKNISAAQVQSQIDVLNADFGAANPDTTAIPDAFKHLTGNAHIAFVLATTDPDGRPTNGITRTKTSLPFFKPNDAMKFAFSGGINAWPYDQYLNIWVCDLSTNTLGYAQFPNAGNPSTDGVVVDYAHFGTTGTVSPPYHLGRTATHEVGHWLNLRHIWGEGGCSTDDGVEDTPLASAPYLGCPAYPSASCEGTDMTMNYMDYTDDDCKYMFSQGQVVRMRGSFERGGGRDTFSGQAMPDSMGMAVTNYCSASGISTANAFIANVNFGPIRNSSGDDGGYGDFTATPYGFFADSSYVFSVTPFLNAQYDRESYGIFLDINADGDFDDFGELLAISLPNSGGTVSGRIRIPEGTVRGLTRLRVAMRLTAVPNSCGFFTNGEVEDYTLFIRDKSQVGQPIPPNTTLPVFTVSPNPVQANAVISLDLPVATSMVVALSDSWGSLIHQEPLDLPPGTFTYTLKMSGLRQGVYYVHILGAGFLAQKRIVLVR